MGCLGMVLEYSLLRLCNQVGKSVLSLTINNRICFCNRALQTHRSQYIRVKVAPITGHPADTNETPGLAN